MGGATVNLNCNIVKDDVNHHVCGSQCARFDFPLLITPNSPRPHRIHLRCYTFARRSAPSPHSVCRPTGRLRTCK
jgi:hypothetical protein